MESISNVSSEEELLQLRNEGRISEDEYQDLLAAMKETGRAGAKPAYKDESKPRRTSRLAIASIVLSLVIPMGCIPGIICGHLALRKIEKNVSFGGRGLALAGLIIGYIFLVPSTILMFSLLGSRARTKELEARLMSEIRRGQIDRKWTKVRIELKRFRVNTLEGIITQSGVEIDNQITSDGNGSLRIEAAKPTTVRLFETRDVDIENARLIYQAKVRTENVEGKVYLEMWCHFLGRGEFFSRGLVTPLTGTTDWTTQEIPFLLKEGENPDNVKLNLVIDGKGTAWIDDIRLLKGLLR